MASRDQASGHLDATGDREVVYCHACAHEWYRDQSGLVCPSCDGEIIEIISLESDPRAPELYHHASATTSTDLPPVRYSDPDSDPDEADIDDINEHMRGENGFVYNRNTRPGAHQDHHEPDLQPVLNRFIHMINDFGPPGPPRDPWRDASEPRRQSRSPGVLHHHHDHDDDDDDFYHPLQNRQRLHHPTQPIGQTRVHRTTFANSPFGRGTASVTIVSGPVHMRRRMSQPAAGAEGAEGGPPSFQEIFASVMRDQGPPQGEGNDPTNAPTIMNSLQEIMGLINPGHARVGDAVYSQEALDRIISNLMEANPTSNAAPPASEEGLKNLERKPVDKTMLDNQDKTECSICIDDISEGDMALFLPCKHWFHEQCVVLWLKEHNTCPICRTPIETREARREARDARLNAQDNDSQQRPPMVFTNTGGGSGEASWDSPGRTWFSMQPSNDALNRAEAFARQDRGLDEGPPLHPGQSVRPGQNPRPPLASQRNTRLNEAIRSVSAMHERRHGSDNEQASSTGVSYDTSRMQRRSSVSPTSPRTTAQGAYAAHRQRSPSQSSGRWAASDRESSGSLRSPNSQRQSGSGPFSWIRNRLPGGGSNNPPRDGRRS